MQAPLSRELVVHGLRLHGLVWPGTARGADPPLLLVHATSFCANVWGPVLAHVRPRGPALAVDQRGHGGSEAPEGPDAYHWTRLAEDVVALASELSPPPVLVGHSSGATACLAAAGMASSRVAGVALVEPVLFDLLDRSGSEADSFAGSRDLAARARKRRALFPSREDARATFSGRFPYSGFARESLAAFLAGGLAPHPDGVALRCTPEHEAWAYEGAAALDVWRWVGRVRSPVALLLAEHTAVPSALAARLGNGLRGCRVMRLSGGTHFVALERPDEVGRALGSFLAELAP